MARILIVEDEMLIAMLVEDIVLSLGHEVVGPAMRLETAIRAVEEEEFELAILDLNLAGQLSLPVADRLKELDIPFMFASGYGDSGLTGTHSDALMVQKPFSPRQLESALGSLL